MQWSMAITNAIAIAIAIATTIAIAIVNVTKGQSQLRMQLRLQSQSRMQSQRHRFCMSRSHPCLCRLETRKRMNGIRIRGQARTNKRMNGIRIRGQAKNECNALYREDHLQKIGDCSMGNQYWSNWKSVARECGEMVVCREMESESGKLGFGIWFLKI